MAALPGRLLSARPIRRALFVVEDRARGDDAGHVAPAESDSATDPHSRKLVGVGEARHGAKRHAELSGDLFAREQPVLAVACVRLFGHASSQPEPERPGKERNPPIPGDFVPLPSPDDGLAELIADLSPPTALTFSTPFVRVPVTVPPSFPPGDLYEHREVAVRRANVGFTSHEERRARRASALERNHSSAGGRYLNMVLLHGWLMLALERERVGWEAALYVAERLTAPPLDWFTLDQATTSIGLLTPSALPAPELDLPYAGRERLLNPYRRMALAVLADVGADQLWRLGDVPEDENRRPSTLLDAGVACGVTQPGTADRRGAREARKQGRRLLHSIGAWPWAHYPDGRLEDDWWAAPHVVEQLAAWRDAGETREDAARRLRAARARGRTWGRPEQTEPLRLTRERDASGRVWVTASK